MWRWTVIGTDRVWTGTARAGDRVTYGLAAGALAGALAGGLDATAVALWGKNIPWIFPALVTALYLLLASLVGGLLAVIVPLVAGSRQAVPGADQERAATRRAIILACVTMVAMIFVERIETGSLHQLGKGFGPAALGVALVGLAVSLFLSSRMEFRWLLAGGYTWSVVWLMLFCLL